MSGREAVDGGQDLMMEAYYVIRATFMYVKHDP